MPARTRINGAVPTRPLGHPDVLWGLPGQGGLLTEWAETVPDLIWPESIRTYGRMRRDAKIAAVLSAFTLPIMRTNWMVDPAGVRQAKLVDLVAGDLGLPVLGEKGPPPVPRVPGFHWTEHLRLALLSNVYGFFPFERWYDPKAKDGLTHLAGLDERMPHTVSMIDLDDNGQVRSVYQNTQDQPLPANRMLWYAHEREGANWAGVSMLRAAYTPWILKHETMRVHATSIRRWGMGVPVVKAPPGGTPAQIQEAQRLAAGMRAGDNAGAGLPDGYTFQVTGITGSVPDAIGFLNYCDQQIASAALAVFLELGLSSGGARALGDTFVDMFLLSLQAAADAIGDTCSYGVPAMPGISRALADLNYGPDEPCPRIVAVDVGDRHEITATAIQQLVMCGAVQPDDELEAFIREAWDFPARTTPRTPPPPPKGTPGAPGAPPSPGTPGGGSPNPAAPVNPNPGAPAPPSRQPGVPRPMTGPPGRRGGQPATGPSRPAGGPTASAAGTGLRRPLTDLEAAAGLDPEGMRAELEIAADRTLAQWAPVLKAQRAELADQVAAAVDNGRLDQLAHLAPPSGDAAAVLYRAMAAVAAQAAGRAVAEAAGQGVTIALSGVQIDHGRLRQLAAARAALAGQALAAAAARKALQVVTSPAAVTASAVTASAGTEAAREVRAVLAGLSPHSLADQLLAALHSAANEARLAVLDAGPEAVYTATELADDPNCCQPCKDVDGHQFASLGDARAAYANGAYTQCLGGLRCRGTVVATWPHTPFHLNVPGTGVQDGEPGIAADWDESRHPRDDHGKWTHIPGGHTPPRGLTLNPGIDVQRLVTGHPGQPDAPVLPRTWKPITAAEARGNSRPVSAERYAELAGKGLTQLQELDRQNTYLPDPPRNWDTIKAAAYREAQKPWGGQTIELHTSQVLASDADQYALSVKPAGMHTVSVPEHATQAQFEAAMDKAVAAFRPELEKGGRYLGVFHDDENNRIDIDPVLVVGSPFEVETIGAYTHAIGGAYHFKTGDGYWPPHVADEPAQTAAAAGGGETVHWAGPGQWRTNADQTQPGLTEEQTAEIGHGAEDGDPGPKGEAARRGGKYDTESAARPARQLATAARGGFDPARHPRGYHGRFGHGTGHPLADEEITGRLFHLFQSEQDPAAREAVHQAGRAYAEHDLPGAARALRQAAGHAADPAPYHDLAGRVESRHAAEVAQPGRAIAHAGQDVHAVAAALLAALKSGGEKDTKPGQDIGFTQPEDVNYFGNTADTSIVTFADGSQWVRKRALADAGIQNEIAYSRVAGALGIPAPVVIKRWNPGGWNEIWEPRVNGQTAIEWAGGYDPTEDFPARDTPLPGRDPAQLYNSREGRMIGLADSIAGTAERHMGNWIVTHDDTGDHPVPIDNNDATFAPVFGSITPFADFDPHQLAAETDADEWAQWRANLQALRGEFEADGMGDKWRNVMSNFAEAERQAGET